MSFLFASSHLPAVRSTRPELEEEEENVNPESLPRSGGVRASSHLEQRVPESGARRMDGEPETHTDNDESHDATRNLAEPEDSRQWYLPHLTVKDLLMQGHDDHETATDSGPPFSHLRQGSRSAFHQTTPTPDGSEEGAAERGGPLQHQVPGARSIFYGRTGHGVDDGPAGEARGRNSLAGGARLPLASRMARAADTTPQPLIPAVKPRSPLEPPNNPKTKPDPDPGRGTLQGQGQSGPAVPPPSAPPVPHPLIVHGADESAQDAQGRTFGDTVRSVMRAEIAGSPTAAALMQHAVGLSKKQIIIKKTANGEAWSEIGPDGSIIVHVNPENLKIGTLSHEISHAIQGWHLEQAKRKKMAETGKAELSTDEINNAIMAGRTELHGVVKVATPADGMKGTTEHRENEAVRTGNVVTAEITAAETRAEIEALKTSDPARYERLIKDPMAVVEMFWRNQLKKEGVGHENNQRPIPKGTRYGLYDFAPVLRSLGYGVTQEHLKQWRQKKMNGN